MNIICNPLRDERNVFKGFTKLVTQMEEDGRGALHSHLIVFSEGGIANDDNGADSQNINDRHL